MSSSGQTLNDRYNSSLFALASGQSLARVACEGSDEVMGLKKKQMDCTNTGCNSWVQAVINSGPNQNAGLGSSVTNSGSQSDNSTNCKGEHDTDLKEIALLSDNWGHTVINQDKAWDLPPSPQSSPKESNSVWKSNTTTGTEIWENTVRHKAKGVTPTSTSSSQPWGHTPSTHIGGTWGEDEDASNVWTGVPSSNGPSNNHNSNWGSETGTNVWNAGGDKQWGGQNQNSSWGDPEPNSGADNGTSLWGRDSSQNSSNSHNHNSNNSNKSESSFGTWSPPAAQPPKKEVIQATGWEDDASTADKRNIDDGTALWGNPTRQSKVSHWKETQNAKPITNYANGNNAPSQSGTNSSGMPSASPGMIRLPPGAPLSNKASDVWNKSQTPQLNSRVWNETPNRDSSSNQANNWGDNDQTKSIPNTPRSSATNLGVWNENSNRESSNTTAYWGCEADQSKSIPGTPSTPGSSLGSGWGESYWNNKPRTPSDRGNWSEGQIDTSNWGGPKHKSLTKEMIWASKQFRILSEMGFKKEDIESALKNCNLNLEEALAELRVNAANGLDVDARMKSNPILQVNQVQNALRSSAARVGTTQSNIPSEKQLLQLVQQIQLAVQTGHLNAQQIRLLQQLQAQLSSPLNKVGLANVNNLHVQITQTKQRISNLQNQIAAQQALFLRQQPLQQQQQVVQQSVGNNGGTNIHSLHQNAEILKNSGIDTSLTMNADLRDLSLKDFGQNQSRLKTTWKLSSFDKDDISTDFSRAPGSSKQTVTIVGSVLTRSDSNSWSGVTCSDESGSWTESMVTSGGTIPQMNDMVSTTNSMTIQAQPQSVYNLNDLVPEFEPGKPWKGTSQLKSIEDDPHITPGSVTPGSMIFSNWPTKVSPSPCGNDAMSSLSLSSSTWAFTPSTNPSIYNADAMKASSSAKTSGWGTLSNDVTSTTDSLWNGAMGKTRGPPPGLSQVKNQTGNVSNAALWNSEARNSQWTGPTSGQTGSAFLLLRNLTPQIDGSTLKTLCMQHGPLQLFHLFLNHGIALVRYSTKEEAAKAQSALNNCVLGNTTILSDIPSEAEVKQYMNLANAGQQLANNPLNWAIGGNNSNSVQNNASNSGFRNATSTSGLNYGNSGVSTTNTSNTAWSGLWSFSSSGSNLWGAPNLNSHERNTPSSLQNLLPGDLLGGEST
ncbi:trinucleotide repeat-containing gene 6A protein-like isoform X1 [Dinothrombium tinctorium]|uniref:Trinucleotide repeat-containing gene 6A protein-like isoform X1 n=1 Tax=Dinothrombium tinctorium TaxID=1965070 RepID=A0A443R6E4_9ACAR|nr:trinucleotide repeat-containing gene 6A protein-like isoform X1 [Dinothrombium tinctorium]